MLYEVITYIYSGVRMRYFISSFIIMALGIAVAYFIGGFEAIYIALLLIILA